MTFKRLSGHLAVCFVLSLVVFFQAIRAQETNPVDRKVSNPITDTPNINPIQQDVTVSPTPKKDPKENKNKPEGGSDEVVVYSNTNTASGEEGKRIVIHKGNVDVHYGLYRLQADKITIYEAQNKMIAEGNVVFDQGDDQRITGSKAEWNYKTKLGYFVDSTGFTNQTTDGTIIYFTADRVERISLNEIVVFNGKFTACEDAKPKWSFTAKKANIRTNDRIKLKSPKFLVKDIPIIPLPYASIPIKKQDRASGFLTPTFGFSGDKGFRLSSAYYQTLGRSADITLRTDLYSSRGYGFGFDVRTRANSRSYLDFGFFGVKDRVLGHGEDAQHPDQGGTTFYANGVHYFPNGFTAAIDVRLYSNLAFRQIFSEGIQQVISPIENSQLFVNKSWDSYTLNFLARSQVITIPNVRISTRNLPSLNFEKRPTRLSFFKNVYFSFKTALEGVSRRESVDSVAAYQAVAGNDPINTPALGQRLDFNPEVSIPFNFKGMSLTATASARTTYYSNSLDVDRKVIGKDLLRTFAQFELDFKPVTLAKNYYKSNGDFRFRHVIEPYMTYRYIKGVSNFENIIRFDYTDTFTDTNEVEFGVTNRFFTRRYTEAVTKDAQKQLKEKRYKNPFEPADSSLSNAAKDDSKPEKKDEKPLSIQPYEIFTLTVRGKYFFDPYFGGALEPGRRNEIASITDLTAFTFGGVPRRWSPLNFDMTYRPRRTIFASSRFDLGVQGDGLRNISLTVGYDTKLVKFFQTFYYTRAVTLIPSLRQFDNPFGKEPGTLRGSQWSPSLFIGNRDHGWFFGTSMFFDFENKRATKSSPLISSIGTIGYAFDCCSMAFQAYNVNVGVRRENRYVFSFKLNGIGTFGTEQIGQGLR
jgi:LPS-assembly protein